MMRTQVAGTALFFAVAVPVEAHHGVASLGVAALEGPGAPVETSTSAPLPAGRWLAYAKVDHARYRTYDPEDATEARSATFWMPGVGYGVRPWLSAYVFQPYQVKRDEAEGADSRGFTDALVLGVVGFKYDEGWRLTPAQESLDDLMDWHFTVYGGGSVPTGDANHRVGNPPRLDPGKALGFGKPAWIYGVTATKQLDAHWTVTLEVGGMDFQEYTYEDGTRMRFGSERRWNAALVRRLAVDADRRFRVDGSVEVNFLRLGRDLENGEKAVATGGNILYGMVGVRLYKDRWSVAAALKRPVWTRLNEEEAQQGSEGKERVRLIATVSALF
ncbi:MAG: transporter [Hydrogenophilus sp.]|nr:transporter [Hydrogenophilus sp.]